MAPEVLRHEPYSQSADLWSVGVILYELITLTRPFVARDISELTEIVEIHRVELANDEALTRTLTLTLTLTTLTTLTPTLPEP